MPNVLAREAMPTELRGEQNAAPIGVDHVGMTCADLDRALRFYRDALGLRVRAQGESEVLAAGQAGAGYAWADLELADGRVVELIEPAAGKQLEPIPPGTQRPGSSHLGMRVVDVQATLARLA